MHQCHFHSELSTLERTFHSPPAVLDIIFDQKQEEMIMILIKEWHGCAYLSYDVNSKVQESILCREIDIIS